MHTRRHLVTVVVAVVALVACAALLGAAGFRLNPQQERIPVPAADAGPDRAVLAYLDAWNGRHFSTMRAVFPSGVPSWFLALGHYHDAHVVRVRPGDSAMVGTGFERHRYGAVVDVRMTITGMETADLTWPNGPEGRSFAVVRDSERAPWTIVGQGAI